jgi:glycosyltransferase involved in cell wall biosynthesis
MYNDHISIVLAVYNGERYLTKLLDSIISQVNVNIYEIIIVDDYSSDRSHEICAVYKKKYNYITLVKNIKNIGPVASFIKGARLASGSYVAFADQDDIWIENKMLLSIDLIKQTDIFNKPSVVFTDLKMIDEYDKTLYDSFWKLHNINPGKNNFFTLLFGNVITGCTMLINRQMLDEFIEMPHDVEMHDHWIALIAASFGIWKYSEEKTVLYRVHKDSVTNKDKVTIADILSNFFNVVFYKNNNFLNGAINQAELFKIKYGFKLDKHINAQLDYFINLRKSPGLSKKITSRFRFLFSKRFN